MYSFRNVSHFIEKVFANETNSVNKIWGGPSSQGREII